MSVLLRRLLSSPGRNLDLLGLWLLSIVVHPLVPLDHWLARADLVPWITLLLTCVALLRGRPVGDGLHPSLTPRHVRWAPTAMTIGTGLVPIATALFFDSARRQDVLTLWGAIGVGLASIVLTKIGQLHGRTGWWPQDGVTVPLPWRAPHLYPKVSHYLLHGLKASALFGLAALIGALEPAFAGQGVTLAPWLLGSALVGIQFLGIGLVPQRLQSLWQRLAAGRRDGSAYVPARFALFLALLGPSVGLMLLYVLRAALLTALDLGVRPVDFAQGPIVALHLVAWAAVIWPPQMPVAVSCVLHEVIPASGSDPAAKTQASFEEPPRGALRLDPLGVKRLRVLHHWLVHVRDPRIEDLDDPVKPLWPRRPFPMPYHVLGEASFEPDPKTDVPQWHTITVRLDEQRDVGRLDQGSAQTRRLAVLRPFPSRGRRPRDAKRTYRWDEDVPPGTLQVVDATTSELTLQDGDILVLSTEGVARAFELEVGSPIYDFEELHHQRPPQLEDYVEGQG